MKWNILSALLVTFLVSGVYAQTFMNVEGGAAWQSQNDQRIPGNGGDSFSLSNFSQGPFALYRIYLGHKWNERHEVRALYAPLDVSLNGQLSGTVRFQNTVFAGNVPTDARYKFNSYRLTYAYHFDPVHDWKFAAGFTAKIRDASVELKQGALYDYKDNVGFVPLLHLRAERSLTDSFSFRADLDGLAASQGRAIDAGLFIDYLPISAGPTYYLGYRTVEGGADNDEVFNFAWFHIATLGVRLNF